MRRRTLGDAHNAGVVNEDVKTMAKFAERVVRVMRNSLMGTVRSLSMPETKRTSLTTLIVISSFVIAVATLAMIVPHSVSACLTSGCQTYYGAGWDAGTSYFGRCGFFWLSRCTLMECHYMMTDWDAGVPWCTSCNENGAGNPNQHCGDAWHCACSDGDVEVETGPCGS